MEQKLLDYIRLNWTKYRQAAIDIQLLQAGFEKEAIEQAWAVVRAEKPIPPPSIPDKTKFWLGLALSTFGSLILGVLIFITLFNYDTQIISFF